MQKSFDKFQQPMKTKTNKQTNKKKTCKMANISGEYRCKNPQQNINKFNNILKRS